MEISPQKNPRWERRGFQIYKYRISQRLINVFNLLGGVRMKIKSWMLMLIAMGFLFSPVAMVYILEGKCEQIVTFFIKKVKFVKEVGINYKLALQRLFPNSFRERSLLYSFSSSGVKVILSENFITGPRLKKYWS